MNTQYGISDGELTEQGIFTKVATHLLKQNDKAETDEGCALRGSSGTSCAVGCLLRDDEIADDVSECAEETCDRLPKFQPFRDLLEDLQGIHDARDPDVWPTELSQLAKARGLVMPEVQS